MKANNLRKGNVIIFNSNPHRIMEFHHHTPGNLRAMVQVKLRNLITGSQVENRFSATEEVAEADVNTADATFLYKDGDGYHFMFIESYEQFSMTPAVLGSAVFYLQDQMRVTITSFNDSPIGIELPQSVILTILDTEPELKGATASNSPKPAKTDTGLALTVPAFVKIGDRIVVGTDEGTYLKRAD